ncbi:MAG: ABC transporter substrate-binding protein [Lactobacillus sp.]|jgi:ABC-type branched-subunit amino acid transport system substrate-binding protein|nr:ABC transporter substrate-binding protein [Lactobacillus sp.]
MKKLLASIIVVGLLSLLSSYVKNNVVLEPKRPIVKIGVVLPITGNLSDNGNTSNAVVEKVAQEVQESPVQFEFIVEDNAQDLKKTAMIANKFVNADEVSAVVSMFTGPGSVVTPVVTAKEVLHICIANDCNIAEGPLNFANWQQMSVASEKLIELLESKKVKKIVIFTMEDAGPVLVSKHVREAFENKGIKFVEYGFNPTERDFALMVEKAKKDKADMWMLNTFSPAIELIRKAMIEKKIKTPVTSIQTFGDAEDKELIRGFDYVEAAEVSEEIKDYVMEKTGSANVTVAAYTYDTLKMIVKVNEDFYTREGRLPTGEEMAKELLDMKEYYGTVGHVEISPERIMYSDTVITQL